GNEICDPAAAQAVDPDTGLHPVSVAGVADENCAARAHVVGAAADGRGDLLGCLAVAAVEAGVWRARDPIGAVEAPDLGDERLHPLPRADADAGQRSLVPQHAPAA